MSWGRDQPERFGTHTPPPAPPPPPLQWDGMGLGTDLPAAKPGS